MNVVLLNENATKKNLTDERPSNKAPENDKYDTNKTIKAELHTGKKPRKSNYNAHTVERRKNCVFNIEKKAKQK